MGVQTMRVPTIFTAVDRFSSVVDRMTRRNTMFGQSASAAAMRTSSMFNRAGTSMLSSGAVMGVGIGYAVNEAIKFEKAIASLSAVTGTEVGSMNKQIESLGLETKRSVIDIAKSFEVVGSKMSEYLGDPDALKEITKSSILMADAARMDLQPAIESLTGVLNIFGKSASDANYIVNKLSAGEIVGSVSIAETADLLRQFGGTARLANVQVDESVALIQTLTKSLGVEGVGRGIRNLMTDLNMVGAFDKNKTKALEKAGVNMDVLGDKSLDLVTRLRELKKLEGNSAAMGMFFKKTGIQTGATLFQNFDDYIRFIRVIKETNKAQEQADKNNATLAKKLKDLQAAVSLLAIKLGDALLPILTRVVDKLIPILQGISDWAKENAWLAKTLFYVTSGLLVFGGIAKLMAVIFYGVSAAIGVVSAVTQAYTFVTTMAALAGTSFAGALGAILVATAPITLPLIAIAAALGLVAMGAKKSSVAAGSLISSQVAALDRGNEAWRKSTRVQAAELAKQRDLMNPKKNVVTPTSAKMDSILKKEQNRQKLSNQMYAGKDMNGLSKNPTLPAGIAQTLFQNKQMEAVLGKQKATVLRNNGFTFEDFQKMYPNVAGYENRSDSDKKGEITINFKGNTDNVESVQTMGNFKFKGVPVKITSTKKPSK